jgi:chromosome segregation ATPase
MTALPPIEEPLPPRRWYPTLTDTIPPSDVVVAVRVRPLTVEHLPAIIAALPDEQRRTVLGDLVHCDAKACAEIRRERDEMKERVDSLESQLEHQKIARASEMDPIYAKIREILGAELGDDIIGKAKELRERAETAEAKFKQAQEAHLEAIGEYSKLEREREQIEERHRAELEELRSMQASSTRKVLELSAELAILRKQSGYRRLISRENKLGSNATNDAAQRELEECRQTIERCKFERNEANSERGNTEIDLIEARDRIAELTRERDEARQGCKRLRESGQTVYPDARFLDAAREKCSRQRRALRAMNRSIVLKNAELAGMRAENIRMGHEKESHKVVNRLERAVVEAACAYVADNRYKSGWFTLVDAVRAYRDAQSDGATK